MIAVGEMRSFEGMMDVLTSNNLSDFITIVKSFPKATDESNNMLFLAARAGDEKSRELLLLTNLRLIVSQARLYQRKKTSYELLDTIQEGIIGFWEAIDGYGLENNVAKFSTYATKCVRNAIVEAHVQKDAAIRRPDKFVYKMAKYKRLKEEYKKQGKKLPSREELCKILDITSGTLNRIEQDERLDTVSLPENMEGIENRSTDYHDFIDRIAEDDVLDRIAEKELLLYLKSVFSPYHYYVLYHGVLSPERKKYSEIGANLSLDHNTVASLIYHDLKKLKKQGDFIYRYAGGDAEILSTKPAEPIEIVKYYFFRDTLDEDEKKLFRLMTSSKYIDDVGVYARILGWNTSYCSEVMNRVNEKTRLNNQKMKEVFESFREVFLKKYGSKIFKLEEDEPLNDIVTNAKYIAKLWADASYEEVKKAAEAQGIEMSNSIDNLVSRYFVHDEDNSIYKDVRVAEREVNALLSGFIVNSPLSSDKLYDVLVANKDRFTEEEYSYLLAYKFNKISVSDFDREYPNSSVCTAVGNKLDAKLVNLYFKTTDYREYNFTRKKYEKIRNFCCSKLSRERMELLDMFYGVGREKLSIKQIAEEMGLESEEVKYKLKDAREAALSVYLGKSNTKRIEADYYIPYIENEDVDINPTYRTMMKEYIIDGMSYEEIAKVHGITKRKVSVDILDGMFKIDLYRFGLLRKNRYSKEEITNVLYSELFSDEDRNIISSALGKMPVKEICAKYDTTSTKVESLMTKLNQNCFKRRVEGVEVEYEDIEREVLAHPCEMVLSPKERLMLACIYGIKCDLNIEGIQFNPEEIRINHPELKSKFNQILENGIRTIAGKKIGLVRATYSYMERSRLRKSLSDLSVPISAADRELLSYAYELNGYPYKSVSMLASERGESISNMGRRIQKIFITIFKYENCEIDSVISPENDVIPNLKYFSKTDQKILIDKYINGMSYKGIAEKYAMSESQAYSLLFRMDVHLRDLIERENVGYDFDYFYECVDKDDIPFYGNKIIARKIFHLYYENHMSANEIIESLGLECSDDVVMKVLSSLKSAVLKYGEGIKKAKTYSLEEVANYYIANKSEMSGDRLKAYKRFFLNKEEKPETLKVVSQSGANSTIVYDLMKENGELKFDMKTATRDEVLNLLRKYKHELTNKTVATLQKIYSIDSSEFMRGSDQMKVLRFLSSLDTAGKILSIELVA